MFRLASITIYPIKSLDGLLVAEVDVLSSGALAFDRRYAIRDAGGLWVNGKAEPAVHLLRATFTEDVSRVELLSARDGRRAEFALDGDRGPLAAWLSDFFEKPVIVVDDSRAGFPDDTESPGPTVVSRETVVEVARWFAPLSADDIRLRFRANLEIEGDSPFCEDRLFADAGHVVRFTIGAVEFEGVNPCQRCIVPTRDARTGAMTHAFSRTFATRRAETLPAWTDRDRFDHFYRLAVNTRLSPRASGGIIRVGDEVQIVETVGA